MERKIEAEMVAYIDGKLEHNALAQAAIAAKDFRLVMVEAAKACVGIHEATGNNDGRLIELIQETVGGHGGEPYCCSGIQTITAYAELKTGLKSILPVTELAQNLLSVPKKYMVKTVPLPGAIAVWADYRGSKRLSTGHCEIVLAADESTFHDVGFNTSGTVVPGAVNREGNGVYYTVRDYLPTRSRKLLGFVNPI